MIVAGDLPPRGTWLAALCALQSGEVATVAADLRQRHQVRHRRKPDSGLAMLQLREPNLGQRFLLGEIPLATAELEIQGPDGDWVIGAAQVLHDDQQTAIDLAICDAVLAAGLDGHQAVADLLRQGRAQLDAEHRIRSGLLRRTQVDFSRLEEVDDDED